MWRPPSGPHTTEISVTAHYILTRPLNRDSTILRAMTLRSFQHQSLNQSLNRSIKWIPQTRPNCSPSLLKVMVIVSNPIKHTSTHMITITMITMAVLQLQETPHQRTMIGNVLQSMDCNRRKSNQLTEFQLVRSFDHWTVYSTV